MTRCIMEARLAADREREAQVEKMQQAISNERESFGREMERVIVREQEARKRVEFERDNFITEVPHLHTSTRLCVVVTCFPFLSPPFLFILSLSPKVGRLELELSSAKHISDAATRREREECSRLTADIQQYRPSCPSLSPVLILLNHASSSPSHTHPSSSALSAATPHPVELAPSDSSIRSGKVNRIHALAIPPQ